MEVKGSGSGGGTRCGGVEVGNLGGLEELRDD